LLLRGSVSPACLGLPGASSARRLDGSGVCTDICARLPCYPGTSPALGSTSPGSRTVLRAAAVLPGHAPSPWFDEPRPACVFCACLRAPWALPQPLVQRALAHASSASVSVAAAASACCLSPSRLRRCSCLRSLPVCRHVSAAAAASIRCLCSVFCNLRSARCVFLRCAMCGYSLTMRTVS
jgi:hypothetical protein